MDLPAPQTRSMLSRLLDPRSRAWPWLVVFAIAVACLRIVPTWTTFSDVTDESYHLAAAISLFEAHKLTQGVQHPPLPRLLPGLVLWYSGARYPPDHGNKKIHGDLDVYDSFDAGTFILLHSPISYLQVLVRSRSAMLPFLGLAVMYVYLLGRWLGGRRAGALAAIFFSFDPTLLGHATWVTTDVASAAGFLAIIYYGSRWVTRPTGRRAIIFGIAAGLGVSCKFSCLVALPAVALLLLTRRPARGLFARARFGPYLRQSLAAAAIAFVVLWATYLFDIGPIGLAADIHDWPTWTAIPAWIKSMSVPMPSFFYGLLVLRAHEYSGHIAYALGMKKVGSWWWYFPLALAVKEPLSFLAAVLLAIGAAARAAFGRKLQLRRWSVIIIPLVLFMAAAMRGHIDIGIRHILPAIPMLYLLAMLGLARTSAPRGLAIFTTLMILACIETAWVHPDYLAFFNVAAGGPQNGQHWLLDSNLDWGQDKIRLASVLQQHAHGRTVSLRLFGGPRLRDWPHPDAANGGYDIVPQGQGVRGLLAVSKNVRFDLYPSVFRKNGQTWVEEPLGKLLARLRPNAHVGYSIDIYDMDNPLIAR
jgi:hypothetical protein